MLFSVDSLGEKEISLFFSLKSSGSTGLMGRDSVKIFRAQIIFLTEHKGFLSDYVCLKLKQLIP